MRAMKLLTKFQFHKGTIKTSYHDRYAVSQLRCFNSIKVRLKLFLLLCVIRFLLSFNSIKVRLKLIRV